MITSNKNHANRSVQFIATVKRACFGPLTDPEIMLVANEALASLSLSDKITVIRDNLFDDADRNALINAIKSDFGCNE